MMTLTLATVISIAMTFSEMEGTAMIRETQFGEHQVRLDVSKQILRLGVPEQFRGIGSGPPLEKSLAGIAKGGFLSAAVFAQKAKIFDDGMYAAIELASENGKGKLPGKRQLLKQLSVLLQDEKAGESIEILYAGAKLGDPTIAVPDALTTVVQKRIDGFLAEELLSKPLGFYTWNEALSTVFRRDRMLQTRPRNSQGIDAVAKQLAAGKELEAAYTQHLSLAAKLTNRLKENGYLPLLQSIHQQKELGQDPVRFFPPSRAWETDLIESLYGNKPIPDGFRLVDELIKRIQSGQLKIHPTPDSGWYDYQTWSLEPLVIPEQMPEAKRLVFEDQYKELLLNLFRGVLALTRETHIKQLDIPRAGSAGPRYTKPVIWIDPHLSVEPLLSYYQRRVVAYQFVQKVLEEHLGKKALKQMHRETAAGPVSMNLADELAQLQQIFLGAYAVSAGEIGLAPETNIGDLESAQRGFASWRQEIAQDGDLSKDVRMMVPVFYDVERKKTKVWAFLGWKTEPIRVTFQTNPIVASIRDKTGKEAPASDFELKFSQQYCQCTYPVFAEVYVTKILDRTEFRALCDQFKTKDMILNQLQ